MWHVEDLTDERQVLVEPEVQSPDDELDDDENEPEPLVSLLAAAPPAAALLPAALEAARGSRSPTDGNLA